MSIYQFLYFRNSKSVEILKHFYRPLKRARLQVLCSYWLNDAGSFTFFDRKQKSQYSPVCDLDGLSFFWRTQCWFFFLSSSMWPLWLPCLSVMLKIRLKGMILDNTPCLSASLDHLLFPPFGQRPTLLVSWVASLLPIWDEKSHWCIWFHKRPPRGWIMQPESEGEFTWLWPSRKQEKGRSQINSPSFLPSSLSSGEGLSAKQKAACFFVACEAGPACKCITLCWVAYVFTLHLFFLHFQHPGFVP